MAVSATEMEYVTTYTTLSVVGLVVPNCRQVNLNIYKLSINFHWIKKLKSHVKEVKAKAYYWFILSV